jgi:hypothetical protein
MSVVNFGAMETQAAGHRRLLSKVTAANWAELKTKCEAGGNEVALSDSFDASVYAGEINFSGKTCVVIGHGQTLGAGKSGRFFDIWGAGSSLEVHGLVLKNGYVSDVSEKCWSLQKFPYFSSMSGGGTSNSIGRSNSCPRRCQGGDLHLHLREQRRIRK